MTVHDFHQSLNWSNQVSNTGDFWNAVYTRAFPTMTSHATTHDLLRAGTITHAYYKQLQHSGVDRIIELHTSLQTIQLTVDEKNRNRPDPGDILLEYAHDYHNGHVSPGWIEKDLAIDYLACAFVPSRRCYLFDWRMLRRAWLLNREDWLARYDLPPARNKTYNTRNVAIPTDRLQAAVGTACVIDIV